MLEKNTHWKSILLWGKRTQTTRWVHTITATTEHNLTQYYQNLRQFDSQHRVFRCQIVIAQNQAEGH